MVLNPDGLPALPKGSAGFAFCGRHEDAARKACTTPWDCAGMNKGQQHRQTKKVESPAIGAHDPLIVELVKLLARSAAERDYAGLCHGNAKEMATKRQGE